MTVVAREVKALDSVRARLGVVTIAADVTEETAAKRILGQTRPDILVLNAGAKPPMGHSARKWYPCWKTRNMPTASPSG